MSRTIKNTVDYFPHFSKHGKTLFILKSRFGNDGYAFWFQLLELLSQAENHFYDCKEEELWQYLLSYCGSNAITGTEILDILAKLGNIDAELWKLKVIWCQALVDNFSDIYKKRGREKPSKPVIVTNNTFPDNNNPFSATEMPQSKVKESKVNNINNNNSSDDEKNIFKLYESNIGMIIPMSSEKLKDFIKEYPIEWICDAIKESVRHNKRNIAYIEAILENRKNGGKSGINKVNTKKLLSNEELAAENERYIREHGGRNI